jgi:hypothetical protein
VLDIPYDSSAGWITLPVTIDGHALAFLLDHGTGFSVITPRSAQTIGLTSPVADSLQLGTSVLRNVPLRAGNLGRPGILGAPQLAQYDFVLDGPARRVRLYAVLPDTMHTPWLPPGVTPADCTPMLPDPQGLHRAFFELQANGVPIHSMFDSGARFVNINMAALQAMGLSDTSANVTASAGTDMLLTGPSTLQATHVPLTAGRAHLRIRETTIHVFPRLPRQATPQDAELSLGLYAVLDRVFVVSYSTNQVCFGKPAS